MISEICAGSSSAKVSHDFENDLNDLRDLRDQLAHAATFVDGSHGKMGVPAFVDKFEAAKRWIDQLTKLIFADKASA